MINTYFRLLHYLKPYWFLFTISVLFTLLYSTLAIVPIFLIKNILDDIFIARKEALLLPIALGLITAYLLMSLAHFFSAYLLRYIGQRVIMDVRNHLYRHLQYLSLGFFQKQSTGELMSRITNDTLLLEDAMARKVSDLLKNLFSLIALAGYIFYLSYYYAFFSLIIFPLVLGPIVKFARKLRKLSVRSQEYMAGLNSVLFETFTGINIVKAFCMEDFEFAKFQRENQGVFKNNIRAARIDALTPPMLEFLGAFAGALIIVYGGYHVIAGSISAGTFMTFIIALFSMHVPVRRLNDSNFAIQRALASAIRIFTILDTKADIYDRAGATELPTFQDQIAFHNVSFRYERDYVLREINLKAHFGQTIALVGESGAGKSTLVNLIPRFFEPDEGSITIDGNDINTLTLKSLRSQIGIVSQDTVLFNDTIKNNIAYGLKQAPLESIMAVAQTAYAHEFIADLQSGYDTVIGERGATLSGGQKQRISIARALFKNPPILILDEATSSLDTESERIVQLALANLMKNRTTFVIAHRLSTIRNADIIVVLENGSIVEKGTHEELLASQGVYRKLYEMQFVSLKN
ncbi:ABC transporter ATP-binding protein [candidate division CSSED10-310 bacterium]|uniref:ABC transporter ATP-binding protein n=1 Tax=candidate division CSSED10-310 bacterium TaxID=2855610 RepID=A0ABV6YU76_UNCC1